MHMLQKEGTAPLYMSSSGKLPYGLTNDYLFRTVLQENNKVLKGLTCSLKHLKPEEIKSVTVQNPIALGEAMDDKTFILDIKVLLNDESIINYEMQTYTMANWEDRSLLYLCRAFDSLKRGEKYDSTKDVTHIGFLNYTLFPEMPEFYAVHKIMNVKNYHLYTDKFTLSVVDLSRIVLATEEDKKWQTDYWASLFKATTWEEIKMLAEKNEMIQEAADTMYRLSQNELIREQCLAREDYNRQMEYYERKLKESAGKDVKLNDMESVIAEKDRKLKEMNAEAEAKDKRLREMNAEAEAKDKRLREMNAEAEQKDKMLKEMNAKAVEKDKMLKEMNAEAEQKDKILKEMNAKAVEKDKMLREISAEAKRKEQKLKLAITEKEAEIKRLKELLMQ